MTDQIPSRFEATPSDKNIYLGRSATDQQLHFVLKFENRIDEEILSKALRLSLDAEPVLGCRLIINDTSPYWERRKDLDDIKLVSISNDLDFNLRGLSNYVLTQADPTIDPLIQAKIFRDKSDILCLKINHVVMDVGGLKEYMALLSSIYNELIKNKNYLPIPNIAGDRSFSQILKQYDERELKKIYRKTLMITPQFGFPCSAKQDMELNYTIRKIDLKKINDYRRKFHATVNDVILTLFSRILFKILKPEPEVPIVIHVANDLRRYLPNKKAEAVCTLVVQYFPKIMIKCESPFEETLRDVKTIMEQMKAENLGLGSAFFQKNLCDGPFSRVKELYDKVINQSYDSKKQNPILSNFGMIYPSIINFNNLKINDAYILGPVDYLPNFLLGVSGFEESLFFSVGHNETETFTPILDDFFNLMEEELKKIGIDGMIKVI